MGIASDNHEHKVIVAEPGRFSHPCQPRGLRWALRFLKIPGMSPMASKAILYYLPECTNIQMEPGFRVLFGKIKATNVSFCNTFCQDYADIIIGEGTSFSYDCHIITASHDIENDFNRITAKPVFIGRNVWIASRVTILGGARIGDGAVIGACSLVRGEIPSNTLAAGIPAKPIRALKHRR